jgi:hypothetical protein
LRIVDDVGIPILEADVLVEGMFDNSLAVAIEKPMNLVHVRLLAQVCQALAVMTAFAVTLLCVLTRRFLKWTIWFIVIIITMNLVNPYVLLLVPAVQEPKTYVES